jgi:hypothetical protein
MEDIDSSLSPYLNASDAVPPPQQPVADNFDYYLWVYVSPPLFLLGITGNSLTFLVMQRKMFRSTSTSVYMSLIAAMDTSFLVVGLLLDWLEWCQFVTVKNLHDWACKIYRCECVALFGEFLF